MKDVDSRVFTRMLRKEGRTEGSVTISLRNFVGEGIKKTNKTCVKKIVHFKLDDKCKYYKICNNSNCWLKILSPKKIIIIILHAYHHKHVTKYLPEILHNYTGNIISGETIKKKKDTNGN